MHTPVTLYDYSERDRVRLAYRMIGIMFLCVVAMGICLYYQLSVLCSLFLVPMSIVTQGLNAKTDITRFGVFRYDKNNTVKARSLKWNEVSGVEVDREQQIITVTGTPKGKDLALSLVIKCSNGEIDEVLALLAKQMPAHENASGIHPPAQGAPTGPSP